jgi:hypothetical protein
MADPITDYDSLVAAVLEAAEDVGTELLAYLPVAIDNAENKLSREIDILSMVYTSTATVAASTATFNKPDRHKITHSVKFTDPTTGRTHLMLKKTDDYLDEYWPNETSAGSPKYYADEDGNSFRIAPCASASTIFTIRGVRRPAALTSANPTNAFTSVTPDALFYATMVQVAKWQRNTDLVNFYTNDYNEARDGLINEARRQRRDDGTPVNNPEVGQNTLGPTGSK